ncbi:hypothetical protein [Rhodoferax sp.]|uniref:hypothetical protein n=1 Tax=Rhodoferax sp. TaxID=50421 RepID=UPI00260A7EB4|nr:hypothetical protein [Rhodoferax sp.]MDD2917449.1 hypothetical protein [Rhodoferax sp.]
MSASTAFLTTKRRKLFVDGSQTLDFLGLTQRIRQQFDPGQQHFGVQEPVKQHLADASRQPHAQLVANRCNRQKNTKRSSDEVKVSRQHHGVTIRR